MNRVVAAVCSALCVFATQAAAQHEHHRVTSLDSLTVRATRDAVALRNGVTVVDTRTSAAAGGSIADVLRTVPGVELDGDGRISMRGSHVLVLMNGRRSALTGDALVAFLRQMPATALQHIEAGSASAVRQNANGAGGVLNLVFRDDVPQRAGNRSAAASLASDDHYMASVALRGTYSWMEGEYRNSSAFVYTNSAGNTGTSATGSVLEHVIPSAEVGAVATVDRGRFRFTSEARTSFVDEDFRGDYSDEVGRYSYMTKGMTSRQREHVLQSDVAFRFTDFNLDVGQESQFRTIKLAHDATHFGATVSQDFEYASDVHAGYVVAHRASGGLRAEAGLRVEADHTTILPTVARARTSVRFFPNVSGEWTDARRALVVRLAYGRRINRPGAEMLNPFSMNDNDTNFIGNPALQPEVSDQVEVGVSRDVAGAMFELKPFYRRTRDPIRALKAATSNGGATTALANLTHAQALGADASVRARPTDRTVVMLAGSVAHTETTDDVFSSTGMYATGRITVDVRVAENTTVQLYAYRRSAQVIEQGEILPAFTSELALTHRLAGERARVTLRINDPLRSDRLAFRITGANFTQQSHRLTSRPLFSLFASCAMGGVAREDETIRTHGPARIF